MEASTRQVQAGGSGSWERPESRVRWRVGGRETFGSLPGFFLPSPPRRFAGTWKVIKLVTIPCSKRLEKCREHELSSVVTEAQAGLGFTSPSQLDFDFCFSTLSIVSAKGWILEIILLYLDALLNFRLFSECLRCIFNLLNPYNPMK